MLELLEAIQGAPSNRRVSERYQPAFGTTCVLSDSQKYGLVWDISSGGLGLLLSYAPNSGETITVTLGTEADPQLLPVAVRVAHVRQLSTGDYSVGARFDRKFAPDEIEQFVTPTMAKPYFSVAAKPAEKKGRSRA